MADSAVEAGGREDAPSEEFLAACGGKSRPTLRISGGDSAEERPFVPRLPFVLVGRCETCELLLPEPEVSFRHAYLQLIGGRWICADLSSRTGVQWPDGARRLDWVRPGEAIQIGAHTILFPAPDPAHVLIDTDSHDAGPSLGKVPEVRLEFLNSSSGPKRRSEPLHRPVTLIGSSKVCKFQLNHESVSKVHCSLVLTSRGLWVVDLLGRGGTLVDGERIAFQRLQDGSKLKIGRFRMCVRFGSSRVTCRPIVAVPARESSVQRLGETSGPAVPEDSRQLMRPGSGPLEAPLPGNDLTTPDLAGPTSADRLPGYSEEFVLALVHQFAAMQQQMFSQVQQQMALMSQMFNAVHHSQQDALREELARVHAINRELQDLHRQALVARETDTALISAVAAPISESTPSVAAGCGIDRAITCAPTATGPVGGEPKQWPPGTPTEADGVQLDPPPAASTEVSDAAEGLAQDSWSAESGSAGVACKALLDGARQKPSPDGVATHAWLAERMSVLEQERSSRWNRILRALSGARNDG